MKTFKRLITACALFSTSIASSFAMIYHGTEHQMTQPNGDKVSVYLYGTELYIDAESQDHYTLIKDEQTGYICYALLSSDGKAYASTGIVYKGGETPSAVKMITQPGVRISKESRDAKIAETKKSLHMDERPKVELRAASVLPDTVYGVCCLIDFPDTKSSVTIDQIKTYLNDDEKTVFGNAMSIKKYFQWISGGKLTYINYVPSSFYTAPQPKDYYSSLDATEYTTDIFYPVVEKALLSYTREKDGFDVRDLTTKDGGIMAINILYAGRCDNKWATGLWPHMNYYAFNLTSKGFRFGVWHGYQLCDIGDKLSMATFCHENGHLVCGWPDFYSYDDHEDNNAAKYNVADITYLSSTPQLPNPWALDQLGWLSNKIDITDMKEGQKVTLKQEPGSVAVYHGKGDSRFESYYIEIRDRHIATAWNNDKGIFIWHSNERGNNNYEGKPELLDCRPATDKNPFWTATTGPAVFSDESDPSAKWQSGEDSGIYLWDFSPYGTTMTFRCGPKKAVEPLNFLTSSLHTSLRAIDYVDTIRMVGGEEPFQFELALGDLPLGLEMSADGVISGLPLRSGFYEFVVRVKDADGQEVDGNFSINIEEMKGPYFSDPTPIPGVVDMRYFDRGGKSISYWSEGYNEDFNVRNDYATVFCSEDPSGIRLKEGEWVKYTIETRGDYHYDITDFDISYSSKKDAKVLFQVDRDSISTFTLKGYDDNDLHTQLATLVDTKFSDLMKEERHEFTFIIVSAESDVYLGEINIQPIHLVSSPDNLSANGRVVFDKTSNSYIYYNADNLDVIMVYSVNGLLMEKIRSKATKVEFGASYPAGVYIVRALGNEECFTAKVVKR